MGKVSRNIVDHEERFIFVKGKKLATCRLCKRDVTWQESRRKSEMLNRHIDPALKKCNAVVTSMMPISRVPLSNITNQATLSQTTQPIDPVASKPGNKRRFSVIETTRQEGNTNCFVVLFLIY